MTYLQRDHRPFSGESMRSESLLAQVVSAMFTSVETSKMASTMPLKSSKTNTLQKRRLSSREKFKFCSVLTKTKELIAHTL